MCAINILEKNEIPLLHCDNDDCKYQESLDGPYNEKLVNKICPECSGSLLTQEDFDDSMTVISEMYKSENVFNTLEDEDLEELTITEFI